MTKVVHCQAQKVGQSSTETEMTKSHESRLHLNLTTNKFDFHIMMLNKWPQNCHQRICSALHIRSHTHTHTHQFNGPLSGTTQVSRHQKGKTNLDFTQARDREWQWHQLGHMQICTSLQTNNHASTPPLSFYRPDALPATQPTVSKHWRRSILEVNLNQNCVSIT